MTEKSTALFYIHLSNVLFALTALFVAGLSGAFSGYFTSFARFFVGTLLGFTHLALSGNPFRVRRFWPWFGRGVFGSLAMTLYYIAIELGSAGRASLLNNTFPIFVAIISFFVLRERVRLITAAGILLAFTGVAFVLADGSPSTLTGDLVGLASGILGGVSYHFNKRATRTEHPIVIYLSVCLVGMVFNAFSVPEALGVNPLQGLLLLLAGAGAYAAQVAITIGLSRIDTTQGSVHTFAKIPLTILGGILIFQDPATFRFFLGTALLAGGILLDKIVKPKKGG